MGKKLLPAGSNSESATPTSRSPETWVAGRVLEEAGGVWSAASGLSATRITCRKKGGGEDEKENEEELLLSHPSKGLRDSSSLPLQQLWTLSFTKDPFFESISRNIFIILHFV